MFSPDLIQTAAPLSVAGFAFNFCYTADQDPSPPREFYDCLLLYVNTRLAPVTRSGRPDMLP